MGVNRNTRRQITNRPKVTSYLITCQIKLDFKCWGLCNCDVTPPPKKKKRIIIIIINKATFSVAYWAILCGLRHCHHYPGSHPGCGT